MSLSTSVDQHRQKLLSRYLLNENSQESKKQRPLGFETGKREAQV